MQVGNWLSRHTWTRNVSQVTPPVFADDWVVVAEAETTCDALEADVRQFLRFIAWCENCRFSEISRFEAWRQNLLPMRAGTYGEPKQVQAARPQQAPRELAPAGMAALWMKHTQKPQKGLDRICDAPYIA